MADRDGVGELLRATASRKALDEVGLEGGEEHVAVRSSRARTPGNVQKAEEGASVAAAPGRGRRRGTATPSRRRGEATARHGAAPAGRGSGPTQQHRAKAEQGRRPAGQRRSTRQGRGRRSDTCHVGPAPTPDHDPRRSRTPFSPPRRRGGAEAGVGHGDREHRRRAGADEQEAASSRPGQPARR